jgi:hypothetical protein
MVANQSKEMTLNNVHNNQLTTGNHTLGARLKTVICQVFCQNAEKNDALYVENSVDVIIRKYTDYLPT